MPLIGNKTYTVSQVWRQTSLPRAEAVLLLAFLLKKNREYILAHPDLLIPSALYKKFRDLETKRLNDWPLAYLTGEKEFYGLNFKVSPAVLTPRPETEMIIEKIIELTEHDTSPKAPAIVDIGTGSGAIIITVASELRRLFPPVFKDSRFTAVDISAPALKIAKTNAQRHQLAKKIKFLTGNLLAPLKLNAAFLAGRRLIIAANLPYLTLRQIKRSPSISREPLLALDGGSDGLKYYEELWGQLKHVGLLNSPVTIFCEIDPSQPKLFSQLAKKYFPEAGIKILKDLSGRDRLAEVSL